LKGAALYLAPDEELQAVFPAKRPEIKYNDRAVVATPRRLLLLELNFFGRPIGVVAEVERDTRLGPCAGFMQSLDAFGTPLAVNERFFEDVSEADRAAGFDDNDALAVAAASSGRSRLVGAVAALFLGFVVVIAADLVIASALGVSFADIGWWQFLPNIPAVPLALWAVRVAFASITPPVRAQWKRVAYVGTGLATLYVAFFTLPMEALAFVFLLVTRPTPASGANREGGGP
jgi:hypothetical protein